MYAPENDRYTYLLKELEDSNFNLADGDPNIKGWKVKVADERTIGEVIELLIDTENSQIRYLLLDMEGNELNLEARNVLIPIGLVELNKSNEYVFLPNITKAQLEALPVYIYGKLTREKEIIIFNILKNVKTQAGIEKESSQRNTLDDFYDHELYFNDKLKLSSKNVA
jgi:hypothetical protein